MTTIAIRNESLPEPLGTAYSRAVDEFVKAVSCPRCECEVYAVGISLEYFVGSIFLALADIDKGSPNAECTHLAMMQLERKEKIAEINNAKLNQMLQYFYDNGGPVMEFPVDEQRVAKIAPRFNALVNSLLHKMDALVIEASAGHIKIDQMEAEIGSSILETYTAMKALYREYELRNAYDELIRIRVED